MTPFLVLSIGLFLVWLLLFLFSKETRRELIIMSFIGLLLAPAILMVVVADYRGLIPTADPVRIEGLLFVFSLFGVSSVVYEALLGKHLEKWRGPRHVIESTALHWISQLIIIFGIWAFIAFAAMSVFPITSVQGFLIGGLMVATYIIADRKDLLLDALLSGAFMAALIFLAEQFLFFYLFPDQIGQIWQTEILSGLMLGVIPLEEILWAAVTGFTLGPLYEYVRRFELRS